MKQLSRTAALGSLALLLGLGLVWSGLAQPSLASAQETQQTFKRGDSHAEVPAVRGKRQQEAERMLKDAGFDLIQVYEVDTDKKGLANVVRDQKPLPGKDVSTNMVIKITVYRYAP